MNTARLARDLEQALADVPMIDVHTHLVGGKLEQGDCTIFCCITWRSAISMRPVARAERR